MTQKQDTTVHDALGAVPVTEPGPGAVPPRRRRGFTLVEMLVVITIISILASLVLVGAAAARRAAARAAIKTEIDQLDGAFQEYKQRYGSFPPNTVTKAFSLTNKSSSGVQNVLLADLQRHFKQAFPKHQEPESLFRALVGADGQLEHGMTAAEAVYFWLGGFSSDARYPISGKGGPAFDPDNDIEDLEGRQPIFGFDLARLGPRADANGDGIEEFAGRFIVYQLPNGQRRRINLWTVPPRGYEERFHYFDTSRYKPAEYDPVSGQAGVTPLKTLPASGVASGGNLVQQVQYANPQSFQILHAGIDDEWGNFQPLTIQQIRAGKGILYPTGPFIEELGDTQVNFSTETLESSQP